MTAKDADLLVVGAGPVGLAAAIEARLAGQDVLLVEAREGPIDKACGEGLMPGALTALRRIGVDPAGHDLAGIAYLNADHRVEHRFTGGGGRGVRRTVLQAALAARAADLGVRFVRGRVTGAEQGGGSASVRIAEGGTVLTAPWLIAADGLHSPIRRHLGLERAPQPERRRRFGLRRHYALAPWTDFVEVHWAGAVEAYVTPVGPQTVGIAVLGPRNLRLDEALAGIPQLAERLGAADASTPVRGAGPLLQRTSARTQGRVLLVGDASGYVDALTGEGMRVGFAQARSAVDAVLAGRPQQYERAWRTETRDFRLLTTALVRVARSPLRGRIVPLAAACPGLYGRVVERLAR
ncbi:NAD(P)/FAD-dependent oxidoreductase [Leifsonia poae]|uniref:NAD(P)/FAD-dependent oxidoreductase n=1 Tax=Leifsonia poae TaxID=110933 RepID=UPI001CBCBB22|nr:NAD(P)/FAD-dependent oxidoreductase [Leifsonia poae]